MVGVLIETIQDQYEIDICYRLITYSMELVSSSVLKYSV